MKTRILLSLVTRDAPVRMGRRGTTWKGIKKWILSKEIVRIWWLTLLIWVGWAMCRRMMLRLHLWEDVLSVEHHLLISPLSSKLSISRIEIRVLRWYLSGIWLRRLLLLGILEERRVKRCSSNVGRPAPMWLLLDGVCKCGLLSG